MDYTSWIKKLTLREQAGLLSGMDWWHTASIDRFGIPSVMVSDGPTGLRKEKLPGVSITSVCYPSAAAMASSWDKDAIKKVGETLGEECLTNRISVLLGPGINIKRSPLCGRNFEYYSEDPVAAGELASHYIEGVQSKGVGTSIKHFAGNSTEKRRMIADSIIDERAMREIYLRGFEIAVKNAKPWTIMAAYNKINGKYCTQNRYLLTDILRKEWGYEGLTVSDWGSVHNRVPALKAGLDLEMPSSGYYGVRAIAKAYRDGTLTAEDIETSALRVLRLVEKSLPPMMEGVPQFDMDEHHKIARETAAKCPVLLKNGGKTLPVNRLDKVAVIGARAKDPIFQGAGSAQVNSYQVDNPYLFLEREIRDLSYAPGYNLKNEEEADDRLLKEAAETAKKADKVLLFVSCRAKDVCEGMDRENMKLPESMNRLVEEVCKVNDKVAVILTTGSAVELPWADRPDAILQTYLLGEAFGGALADLLLGRVSPSGKLSESYPMKLEDTPCLSDYQPDENNNVKYRESIFVGYRYYEASDTPVRYPFGHGLSYTRFDYSNLRLSTKEFKADDTSKVVLKFDVTNVGKYDGAEAVQVYVGTRFASFLYRAPKELKAFAKVNLKAGEMKTVELELDRHAFEYYSAELDKWAVEPGNYKIMVGASSADIRLESELAVASDDDLTGEVDYRVETPNYYTGKVKEVDEDEFLDVLGYYLDDYIEEKTDRLTTDNCISDADFSAHGKAVNHAVNTVFGLLPGNNPMLQMGRDALLDTPIRRMVSSSRGVFSENMADGMVHFLNGGTFGDSLKLFALGIPDSAVNAAVPLLKKAAAKKDKLK